MEAGERALLWLYGERLKAELHIAFQVLDELEGLPSADVDGGRRVAQAFFEALCQDVRLTANVLSGEDLRPLERLVVEAAGRAALREFGAARERLSRAMSAATSLAARGGMP